MTFVERVLRAMTHLNIGATIATAMWILWSGVTIVDSSNTSTRLQPPPAQPSEQPARPARTHDCQCDKSMVTAQVDTANETAERQAAGGWT